MWYSTAGCIVMLTLSLLAAPPAADARRTGEGCPDRLSLGSLLPLAPHPGLWPCDKGSRELGWIEGQNLMIEERWAEGRVRTPP